MNSLIIIAAGEGSRMGYLPKAISLINGKPNLYNTVEKAYQYFDSIYICSLKKYETLYTEIVENFSDKCKVVTITSGWGCGDAVLEALHVIANVGETPIVMWGDLYVEDGLIFKELLDKKIDDNSAMIMPVVMEPNPYVWIEKHSFSNKIRRARFSKRGETISAGHHDQSMFKIDFTCVWDALTEMKNVLWKYDTYMPDGQLEFMDILHYLFNTGVPATFYETEFKTYSYNTHDELKNINEILMSTKKQN